jgi:secreted trypsin-like serine protease
MRIRSTVLACLLTLALPGTALGIVNGRSIAVPAYMGFVAQLNDDHTGGFCTGFAIRPNVLVTAAHCVVNETATPARYVTADHLHTLFGADDPLASNGPENPVVEYVGHPSFGWHRSQVSVNDIALLRLRDRVAGTIKLMPRGSARLAAPGTTSAVLGWGRTSSGARPSRLQRADLTIQPHSYCGRLPGFDNSRMLCAWSRTQSPCQGDSGSPVLVSGPGHKVYVAGVIDFGIVGCPVGLPFFAANLAGGPLPGWVSRTASRLQRKANAAR